jgi:hypothetical protein
MYWKLVDKIRYTDDKYSTDPDKGNTLVMRIVIDGMKLQLCYPTFISARNTILQAKQQNIGGKYKCVIWFAFAYREVGAHAKTDGRNCVAEDFSVPNGCRH